VRQDQPTDRRIFRRSESDPGAIQYIFKGDKVPIYALDIGVDQLNMKNTYLAGDYEGTMADKVEVVVADHARSSYSPIRRAAVQRRGLRGTFVEVFAVGGRCTSRGAGRDHRAIVALP
jgi:hypothetical protein